MITSLHTLRRTTTVLIKQVAVAENVLLIQKQHNKACDFHCGKPEFFIVGYVIEFWP